MTVTAEGASSGVGFADAVGAGVGPDTIQVDLRPAGRAPASEAGPARDAARGSAKVRYEQFRTVEPEATCRFFAGAYTPGWRVSGLTSPLAVTHRRCAVGSMSLDEVEIQGRLVIEIPPADTVVVIQPRAGSLTVTGVPFPDVDCPVLIAHGMSCALRVDGARFDVVTIGTDVLRKVSADWQAPPSRPIRFLNWRQRSRGSLRAWHRALEYVSATLAAPDTVQHPLIVAALAPLLAGALLECYPSNVNEQEVNEQELAGDPALPETLKDAVDFIHRHASRDVSINDVAAAVHLTPRAVQYLFRRQLDTTPTEYMRRVRLHRAHDELIAGSPSNNTVTEIAQRWGFAHTGRFAVLYRQTYGQSPHTTLKHVTSNR